MATSKRLPVLQNEPLREPEDSGARRSIGEGSLGRDGHHRRPVPADVTGRFARARRVTFVALIALWAALPWIPVGGHPAVFLDVEHRSFFLFGLTFNAQDAWLVFFLLSGVGFGLVTITALLGRAWCGWACPQTVFLETLFRPIERLVDGPRNEALRRARHGMSFDRLWRIVVKQTAFVVTAFVVAHIFLAYFVSLPGVFAMMRGRPSTHPEAFGWMLATTAALYVSFAWFREQLCVVVCPYGRLQSVLLDDDSMVVGYDEKRGEPRTKAKSRGSEPAGGACVDCNRCVVVCPTGIDIRDGLQLDCIACTACIDACDEVMTKLGRPTGLVRYDSLRGLRGEAKRIFRPRLVAYGVLLVVGAVVASFAFRSRSPFEANLVRLAGPPYTREGGAIRNAFELHVVNKEPTPMTFLVEPIGPAMTFVIPEQSRPVDALGDRRVPVFVSMVDDDFSGDRPFTIRITARRTESAPNAAAREVSAVFVGARR